MKKSHLLPAIIIALCVIFLVDCKEKENIIPDTTTTDPTDDDDPVYFSIDEVFKELSVKPKKVTIDISQDNSFYGNSGTRYTFMANSLETMDGTTVTGNVDVEVAEYLDRGDMIFSKMLPVSDGKPLVSGGELDIKASQNGEELRLRDGFTVRANVPQRGTPDPKMEYFRGRPDNDDELNVVNWERPKVDTAGQLFGFRNGVAIMNGDSIAIFTETLNWCNIDRYLKGTVDWQSIKVNIEGVEIESYHAVCTYVLYRDFNAILNNGLYREADLIFSLPDMTVDIIVFVVVDGKFYSGILALNPENNKTYTLTLKKGDPKHFKEIVNKL